MHSTRFGLHLSVPVIGATLLLSGCSIGAASQSPQSHFAYPNSNVIPIGESKGSVSKLCGVFFFTFGSPDGDDQEAATQQALTKAKGDILLNVRTDTKVLIIPPLLALCTTNVRGTAAKMEIGRQQLGPSSSALAPPDAVPTPSAPPPGVAAPAAAPAAPSGGGCKSDTDCKAGRQCLNGTCAARP